MRNYLLGVVSVLMLVVVGGGAYFLGFKKSVSDRQEVSVTLPATDESLTITPTFTPFLTPEAVPDSYVSEQIIAAITVKNTQPIEGYMADTVHVRLESSSCCGLITREEAMSQLSYLDPAVDWSFDPTDPILIDLAAAAPDYYGSGWIVGVASNEYVFSFKLDSQDEIEAYNIAASYKILIP